MTPHTADDARKYPTAGERAAVPRQAECLERQVRTLGMTLTYAGYRLSEALALTADRVDLSAGVLTIESLKKRRTGVFRTVPVLPCPARDVEDGRARWPARLFERLAERVQDGRRLGRHLPPA